jgi:retron-type reverse transcriptase
MPETIRLLAFGLAEAFVSGPWETRELATRAKSVLITSGRLAWVTWLARRVIAAFPGPRPPGTAPLIEFLEHDEPLWLAWERSREDGSAGLDFDLSRLPAPVMRPAGGAASNWQVRPIVTIGELATWLGMTTGELDWFADCQGREAKQIQESLRHYRYRWIPKASGARRLLEVPKPRLKSIQRKILAEILHQIPPHRSAHAYYPRRTIREYVLPHVNQQIVIHIDLREFFPSVRASQVHAIFRTAGYPERVASVLTGLCTNTTPAAAFAPAEDCANHYESQKRYRAPHLPQGAPTSPALANLAAFWLDCRLSGLARKVSANYTRYADDLVFSGGHELAQCASRFRVLATAIAHHEGFEIRHRKTREMRQGSRQQVAGIVLNQRPNIPRREYDTLRAILHNCHRLGPQTQNVDKHPHFREHLLGRIAYWTSICPEHTKKLRRMFGEIDWS